MPIKLEESPDKFCFMVRGPIVQGVFDWQDRTDKLVFGRQVETGRTWKGHEIPGLIQRVQKQAQMGGRIFAWYSGFSGSWGGYAYTIQAVNSLCTVSVRSLETEEKVVFTDAPEKNNAASVLATEDASDEAQLKFCIEDIQLANLQSWESWVPIDALTSRYVCEFTEIRLLGMAILAVEIEDKQQGVKTDLINDYEESFKQWLGLSD